MDGTRDNHADASGADVARNAGEAAAAAAQRLNQGLEQGREALAEVQALLAERTRECIETTDNFVRDNPWQAVGIAAGVGMIMGLLMARR